MTVPALMALEMSRPLNRLTAAAMHMLQPMVSAVMTSESFEEFARFLEHAGSIDYLCEVLERQEADRSGEPR